MILAACHAEGSGSDGWSFGDGLDASDAPVAHRDVPADAPKPPDIEPGADARDIIEAEPDTAPPAACVSTEQVPAPDQDGDCVPDHCDSCPGVPNFAVDSPEMVDGGCDASADIDGDGVANRSDNCMAVVNPAQADADDDGLGDACDRCAQNPALGAEPLGSLDADRDCVRESEDNCPRDILGGGFNPQQRDSDGDGVGDVCDNCPNTPNKDQANFDRDDYGDACDAHVDQCDPEPDICDGLDNDCDGDIDDRMQGNDCGLCSVEFCDDVDNDCDGVIDNGCGSCPNGRPMQPEVCDGADNDCDGVVDEGCCGPGGGQPASRCRPAGVTCVLDEHCCSSMCVSGFCVGE